jgi:hypothetical protein
MTITVTLEEPGAEGVSLTLSFKDGVFGDFPVFLEKTLPGPSEGRHEGRALQGRAQWDPAGALKLLSCVPSGQGEVSAEIPAESTAGISGGTSGAALEAETLSFDEESRPVLLRVKTGETYAFAVLDYAVRRITETWFDEEGNPLLALVPEERGNGRGSYLYNSQGLISELLTPAGTWSALYTSRGLPRYMERRPAAEGPSAAEEGAGQGGADAGQVNAGRTDADPQSPAPPVERYTFQWDEAGRLVRLSGGPGGTPSSDYRYTYVLDDRGNWIERREIRMISREGGLFPAPGLRVRRSFSYGE